MHDQINIMNNKIIDHIVDLVIDNTIIKDILFSAPLEICETGPTVPRISRGEGSDTWCQKKKIKDILFYLIIIQLL